MPVQLPSTVRPWALIPEDAEDDIDPTVRLVGCLAEPVPLHLVDGLCGVVAPLGVATQRRALPHVATISVRRRANVIRPRTKVNFARSWRRSKVNKKNDMSSVAQNEGRPIWVGLIMV